MKKIWSSIDRALRQGGALFCLFVAHGFITFVLFGTCLYLILGLTKEEQLLASRFFFSFAAISVLSIPLWLVYVLKKGRGWIKGATVILQVLFAAICLAVAIIFSTGHSFQIFPYMEEYLIWVCLWPFVVASAVFLILQSGPPETDD